MKENNNEMDKTIEENKRKHLSNAYGMDVWPSLIFTIVAMAAMYFLAKFIGN